MSLLFSERQILPDTFVDNDVIIKTCVYGVLDNIAEALHRPPIELGILASAVFVLSPVLKKREIYPSSLSFFRTVSVVEPSDDEIMLAAAIEEDAMKRNLEVNTGESLFTAIAASRNGRLVTGDKRAIRGLAALSRHSSPCSSLQCRAITLESTMASLLATLEFALVRNAVCTNPRTDLAISACFMCHQGHCSADEVLAALSSYQRSLSADTDGYVSPSLSV